MVSHVLSDLFDAFLALEKVFQVYRAVEDFVQLLDVRDSLGLGEREEFLFHDVVRDAHLIRRKVVVEREGRAVLDALRN